MNLVISNHNWFNNLQKQRANGQQGKYKVHFKAIYLIVTEQRRIGILPEKEK